MASKIVLSALSMSTWAALPVSGAVGQVPASPGARFGHAMAFHAGTGRTLVFGGERTIEGRARLGDSWTWDGARWALADTTGPSPRMDIAIAYDAARDRVVLFGGNGANAVQLTDTWEWDGRSWLKRDDGVPGKRLHSVMAYDAARRRVVLFGGAGPETWLSDTWEWDGIRWERRSTDGPKFMASAAYDASRQAVVGFTLAAQDGSPATGMVMWNGQTWKPIATSLVPPVAPLEPLVAGAPPNVLMAQRSNYHTGTAATWLWNGNHWTADSTAGPGKLLAFSAAFDSRRGRLVLFGGLAPGEIPSGALWERAATGWTRLP